MNFAPSNRREKIPVKKIVITLELRERSFKGTPPADLSILFECIAPAKAPNRETRHPLNPLGSLHAKKIKTMSEIIPPEISVLFVCYFLRENMNLPASVKIGYILLKI